MWALSIVLVMFGLATVLFTVARPPSTSATINEAAAVMQNFTSYCNGVTGYLASNPGFTGTIPSGAVQTPPGWRPIFEWQNTVEGGLAIAWGSVPGRLLWSVQAAAPATADVGITEMQGSVEVVYTGSSGKSVTIPTGSVPLGVLASALTAD